MNKIYFGDNLEVLMGLESETVDLIYIDPPFNTGRDQKHTAIKTVQSAQGDRQGFQGKRYATTEMGTKSYSDSFDDFINSFLRPRLAQAYRVLKPHGSLYFHIDYREVHYCKILLDEIFGRDCFLNEIIWAYDYGGRAKSKWPPKHDNILYYVKDPHHYIFNPDQIDREQYIAPGLVGPLKAERGKLPTDTWWFSYVGRKPTDTWWQTIVPTNGRERLGYPTQKPRKLLDRIIRASSQPGMLVLDFFAGSGTAGESCLELGREFMLVDNNPAALEVMAQRFSPVEGIEWIGYKPAALGMRAEAGPRRADTDTAPALDTETLMLAASIAPLQAELEMADIWNSSPFEWVSHLPPRQKEILGMRLATGWCQSKGVPVDAPDDAERELRIAGHKLAVSFCTLSGAGTYQFPLVWTGEPEYIWCFGMSPDAAHAWVVSAAALRNHPGMHGVAGEHASPSESALFAIDPNRPPDWLAACGGTLDRAFSVLKTLSHRK